MERMKAMNFVLVLRAELVCLIILLYLTLVSRSYRMGKDVKVFNQILFFSILHVVMDIVTVITVNHTDTVPLWLNNLAHCIFYLSAIMYAYEMCLYTLNLVRPTNMSRRRRLVALIPVAVYVVLLLTPLLPIEYVQMNGTKVSTGPAAVVGYVIAFAYFAVAIGSIFINWNKVGAHFKKVMLPMLFLLIISELIQTQVKEFLFTGCAITAITVAFFFTLENPTAVLERKFMMDALSGLGTRSGYEHDMLLYDQEFEQDRNIRFTFLFVDINNLKSVNGLFGHQEGDSYISDMAVLLMTNLRNAEHIYRMGGDEFLAVYRKTDEKTVIKDIRRVQEACKKGREKHEYTPELAIGYAISDPKYNSLRDVLRVADYMMYRNKADIKRDIVEDTIRHTGTHLNLSGLTDRVFDAMCLTSEEYYPYLTNLETNVTRVAPAMADFFGLEGEFHNDFSSVWMEHVHPDDLQEYVTDISATVAGRKQYHFCRYRAKGKNGEYVDVTCRGGVYHGHDGEPDVFAGYVVNHGATGTVDSATGLRNHQALFEYLEEALREKRAGVVMRLEIRNLNRIRMLYREDTAASLIRNMANDFAHAVDRDSEVFSNQGSNFIFCLRDYDAAKANELYRRIRRQCITGILTDAEMIPVDVAGGAVFLPEETLNTPNAIRQAALFASEEACYHNPSRLWFFGGADQAEGTYNKELLRTIQHDCVMDRSHFFLRFQPIMHAKTGTVAGAEALLRWKSGKHGEVMPGRFIAFLENDPAYEPLGYDIIRQAVRTAGQFRRKLPEFRINVNITAIQLLSDEFIPNVMAILKEENFDPAGLMLELTERCKEMEFELLSERVQELKKTGVRVALDDMGTGFSTIDLLLHLAADEIKLDMNFTCNLQGVEKHEILTRTLCAAAERNNVDICFEGVVEEQMVEYLKGYGDVLLQGYYFDRPLLPEEFEAKYCR
jgi:diguanylate cyclase (GGDEF)-like protein